MSIVTERLILRQWCESDLEPFAALNADPHVMEFFPHTRTRKQSDETAHRIVSHIDAHGFGLWALERCDTGEFIGFTGMMHVDFDAGFLPAVEIGWRLAADQWGNGFATEAARACMAYGFETLQLDEVVSFAVTDNWRSRRVMERIGMHRDPSRDFDHPDMAAGSPLRRHVFYAIRRAQHRLAQVEPAWIDARPPSRESRS